MIFYFSGTGNSYYAAKKIAHAQKEELLDIAKEMNREDNLFHYTIGTKEKLGFVFPVYAWAPPKMVLDFISRCQFESGGYFYTFAVSTCGMTAGKTMNCISKALNKKDIVLHSGFSISMPDNYVVGMDVEPAEQAAEKLQRAEKILENINKAIKSEKTDFFKVKKGAFANIKSGPISALFQMFATKTRWFYATEECNGCGLCERVCTSKAITVDKRPVWTKKNCNMCVACINRCPQKAIQYGKKTASRGRYYNPNVYEGTDKITYKSMYKPIYKSKH